MTVHDVKAARILKEIEREDEEEKKTKEKTYLWNDYLFLQPVQLCTVHICNRLYVDHFDDIASCRCICFLRRFVLIFLYDFSFFYMYPHLSAKFFFSSIAVFFILVASPNDRHKSRIRWHEWSEKEIKSKADSVMHDK